MTLDRMQHLSRFLALAGLWLGTSGCGNVEAKKTVVKVVPPVRPVSVNPESLPDVKFLDVTREAGIHFVHYNGAVGDKLLPETMGAGVAFIDYDLDGDPDLFFVNSSAWPGHDGPSPAPTQALYRNDGKGHFEDVTKAAGLDKTFYGQGVAVGDYDNDGDPDLYVTAMRGGHLFRNDGKGHFEDVTASAHANGPDGWLTGAAFLDIDNDGDLDLFIANYITWTPEIDKVQGFQLTGLGRAYGPPTSFGGSLCALLRNDGSKFTDISESSGIQVRTPDLRVPLSKSLGVAPYDIDGDGRVDIAVANDTVQNFLFHNLGGGKFEEIAIISGVAFDPFGASRGGMGIDWAAFLNDERLGLAVGNFANEMTALYVCDQPSSTTLQFSDLANLYGLGAPTQPPLKFGLFFFDYDLDGRLDLLSANGHLEPEISKVQASETYEQAIQLFWNSGKAGRSLFLQVKPENAGPDLFKPIVGRGSAYADIDGDGDLDVVVTVNNGTPRLFRNEGGNKNHWLRIALTGDGKASNRDAIGAKVEIKSEEMSCRRQLFPSKSYLSSVELPMTFGLGKFDHVDEVTITWPSGKVSTYKGLKADRLYKIEEGKDPR